MATLTELEEFPRALGVPGQSVRHTLGTKPPMADRQYREAPRSHQGKSRLCPVVIISQPRSAEEWLVGRGHCRSGDCPGRGSGLLLRGRGGGTHAGSRMRGRQAGEQERGPPVEGAARPGGGGSAQGCGWEGPGVLAKPWSHLP